MKTHQQLRTERGRILAQIDDIVNTAAMNGVNIEGDERRRHDQFVAQAARLDEQMISLETQRTPKVSMGTHGYNPARDLDGMLWATDERTAAGSISDNGMFVRDHAGATNIVDQVTVRTEQGYELVAPRMSELPRDVHADVRSFQNTVADMVIFGLLVDKHAKSSQDGFEVARSHAKFQNRWGRIMNALDVDTAGEGANWVPTGIGATMHEAVRAAGKVAPLFPRIDLPQNPWVWPIEGADATAYIVAEPTADAATKVTKSTPGTLKATFDAEIFGAEVLTSRSMEADSAVAILPFIRGKIVRAFSDAEEKAILDGDADGTHQDSDVQALGVTDSRAAWDGLRKKGLAQTSSSGGGVLTSTLVKTLRASMLKWGINPSDLALIVGINSYYNLLGDTNLLTVDKYGPQATLLNGQLGSVWGIPVIVSEHMRENLNASGVYDGITTTKAWACLVNRNEWAMGTRMALDVEIDESLYRESYQKAILGFSRSDFQCIGSAATNEDTGVLYNLT